MKSWNRLYTNAVGTGRLLLWKISVHSLLAPCLGSTSLKLSKFDRLLLDRVFLTASLLWLRGSSALILNGNMHRCIWKNSRKDQRPPLWNLKPLKKWRKTPRPPLWSPQPPESGIPEMIKIVLFYIINLMKLFVALVCFELLQNFDH